MSTDLGRIHRKRRGKGPAIVRVPEQEPEGGGQMLGSLSPFPASEAIQKHMGDV